VLCHTACMPPIRRAGVRVTLMKLADGTEGKRGGFLLAYFTHPEMA
jgi:hypothetical protein